MFSINLDISNGGEELKLSTSSIVDASIEEILIEICSEFNRYPGIINFSISGFDKDWSKIDIDSDLWMLMEDLPELVSFIQDKNLQQFQFGFPEQHIQRMFTIERISSGFKISCSDWLAKNLEETAEIIQTEDLVNLIHELVKKIQLAVNRICPVAYENKFFKDWLHQVQI